MKKFLLLFLFAMAIPMTLMAVTINNINYSLDTTNKTATVIRKDNNGTYNASSYVIPATVTYNDEIYNVTSIGSKAFWNGYLESIEISEGVTSIGSEAFNNCQHLQSITLPNSVTSIGERAFGSCSELTSVNIPNGVTIIENYTFNGCRKLTSVEIPEGVTSIGYMAFEGCSSLTSVTIPSSVTEIGSSAFYYCSNLSSVNIPDGVTRIERSTFYWCKCLTSITIPNSVTYIGEQAFSSCDALFSLEIGSGVQTIGRQAFTNLIKLQTVTCNATSVPTTYDSGVFAGSNIEYVTLIVPPEAYDDYYAVKPWMDFGTKLTTKVTANSYTREYGDDNPEFEYTVNGTPLNGTPEFSCTADANSAPGTYPITISRGTVTNTRIVFVDGTLTITKAPLTITANSYTINEGEPLPSFEAECTGLKNGEAKDVVNPVFSCVTDNNTPGYYPVNVTATSDNYDITCVPGALTIKPVSGNTTIKIGEARMATYCSPYDLDFSEETDLKAYIITGYDRSSKRVYAMRVFDVPAGTGLYLVGKTGSYEVPLSSSNSYYYNMLVGTLVQTWIEPTDGDLTNLRLTGTNPSNASFKILSEGRNFSANKAYLQIPTYILGNPANAAPALGIVFDDETNGIEDIMQDLNDTDSEWYTLDGRKFNGKPTARGIYVVKGRKVVIK